MINVIIKHKFRFLLWTFIIAYIIYFSYFTILRFKTLYASYFDLGIMNQTVYNTYKSIGMKDPSRILEMTDTDSINQIKRMAIHTDFLLAAFAPFYFIHQGPETLLVIQTIVVALGAWFIFKIAIELLTVVKHKELLALIFSFAYLLYPPMERANIFDFHAVTLATTFLLATFYFWLKRRYKLSFLFFLLSILSKEQVALTTVLFGLYTLIPKGNSHGKGKNLYSWSLIGTSVIWFVASVFIIVPLFRGAHHFATLRYSDFGDSPIRIIIGVLTSPYSITKSMIQIDNLRYLFFLLSPLGFLSLLSPLQLLVSTAEFAINLLSNNPNMKNIVFHYTVVLHPFIFISAIYGVKKVLSFFHGTGGRAGLLVCLYVMIWSLLLSYYKGPLPYSLERDIHPFKYPQKEAAQVAFWSKTLKDDRLKISSTGQLAPFFTSRRYFYIFSKYYFQADYIILRTNEIYEYPEKDALIPVYEQLKKDRRYEIIYRNGILEIYKKIV